MTMVHTFDSSQANQCTASSDAATRSTNNQMKRLRLATCLLAISTCVFLVSTVVLAVLLGRNNQEIPLSIQDDSLVTNDTTEARQEFEPLKWPPASGSLYGAFKKAAIATDNALCSEIGRDILLSGGNAVDATVAAVFCIGVVNPQSSGLGGGFMMVIYNSTTQRCVSINARETAPASANETMFEDLAGQQISGYRSVATPSELHGLWTVYSRFGSGQVSWNQLLEPSIQLAFNGFPISRSLAAALQKLEQTVLASPALTRVFVNPETKRVYEEGDTIKREHYGATLQLIANSTDPIHLFYSGGFAQTIAAEMQEHGGHVTLEDLRNYKTIVTDNPVINENFFKDYAICGPPPPSSFVITQAIIGLMAELYGNTTVDFDDPLLYHRLIESQKFGYAYRSKLGDIAFSEHSQQTVHNLTQIEFIRMLASKISDSSQPLSVYGDDQQAQKEDHGTSHLSTIDRNLNAVSCTSTVNRILGSKKISPTLGIVWNNQMDDFSTPGVPNSFGYAPSVSNYIEPGKRPMSSMSPMVVFNKNTGKVKLVVGASGGSKIISATAQVAIWTLIFNKTIKEAIDKPRFHNQFLPPVTEFDNFVPKLLVEQLANRFGQNMTTANEVYSTVEALLVDDLHFVINGNSDFRRQTFTFPAGF